MHRYLRDPFYAGKFIYKGKLYKGNHPALITDDEFELLQKILSNKSKGKQHKHDFPFAGIIKCGECSFCVTVETHTKKIQKRYFSSLYILSMFKEKQDCKMPTTICFFG